MISVAVRKWLRGAEGRMQLQVSFKVQTAAMVSVMGPSGAGKTSILKMLAGLIHPDEGSIEVNGETWFSSQQQINKLPQHRSIGFVFQEYALFPNMSVRENLQYALQHRQDMPIIEEVLSIMNIQNLQHQRPAKLSGGQQQRVALARAIVRRPQILLLDEPFAALDRSMRLRLQEDLLQLHQRYQTTTLLVSHDALEVARMADEVMLMHNGRIEQTGSPQAVLSAMSANILEGEVIAINEQQQTVTLAIPHVLGHITLPHQQLQSLKKGDYIRIHTGQNSLH